MVTTLLEAPAKTGQKKAGLFVPDYVFVEPNALNYPLGQELSSVCKRKASRCK